MENKEPPMGKTGIFKKLIKPIDAYKPPARSEQQEVISSNLPGESSPQEARSHKLEKSVDKPQGTSEISPATERRDETEATTGLSPEKSKNLPIDILNLQAASKNLPAAKSKPPAARRKRSGIDNNSLKQAIDEARKQPKITITSFEIAAIMRYVQITTSRFYPSTVCKEMLEKEVREKYSDLFAAVEKRTKR